jgi:hypothetical protein
LSLAIDVQGNKWIGTFGGLAKFDGSSWTIYSISNSGLPSNYVLSLAIDAQGNKWIGTYSGLAKFDGSSWTIYNKSNSGLPSNDVLSLAIDVQEKKWIGTYSGGLAKFDGTNWTVYNSSNSSLPDNNVRSLAIDVLGNKWIGTFRGGLAVYRKGGVSDDVMTSVEDWRERRPAKTIDDIIFSINPNPLSNEGEISYTLNADGYVRISISNILGINIFEIDKGFLPAGTYNQQIDASLLPQGSYFVTISLGGSAITRKMLVIK